MFFFKQSMGLQICNVCQILCLRLHQLNQYTILFPCHTLCLIFFGISCSLCTVFLMLLTPKWYSSLNICFSFLLVSAYFCCWWSNFLVAESSFQSYGAMAKVGVYQRGEISKFLLMVTATSNIWYECLRVWCSTRLGIVMKLQLTHRCQLQPSATLITVIKSVLVVSDQK